MQLELRKHNAFLYWALTCSEKRLPKRLWRWYFSPMPVFFRDESLFESCQKHFKASEWPERYILDPALGRSLGGISFLAPTEVSAPEIIKILDAVILPQGLVVANKRIHPASSCYSRINPHIFFKASAKLHKSKPVMALVEATLVSRQLVDQGTYGDYFIEFLLALCRSRVAVKPPLLADANFIEKYCAADLRALGLPPCLSIPNDGIQVDELTVIGPCQPFDNFDPDNLRAVVSTFPANISPDNDRHKKFYLSRSNFYEVSSSKQRRSLDNEAEIEQFLSARGFKILRPDSENNIDTRMQLTSADVVVFNHGSGFFNAIWGKPRLVIELANEKWWNPAFLRLSRGMKVADYQLLCSRNGRINLENLDSILKYYNQ